MGFLTPRERIVTKCIAAIVLPFLFGTFFYVLGGLSLTLTAAKIALAIFAVWFALYHTFYLLVEWKARNVCRKFNTYQEGRTPYSLERQLGEFIDLGVVYIERKDGRDVAHVIPTWVHR